MVAPADAVFAALADPTRRRMIETLAARPSATASGLARELPITRQAVAKHLSALRAAHLVRAARQGRETHYSLETEPLAEVGAWAERVGAEWDRHLGRLARALADEDEMKR
jgi:DNA-binding transcriptional ArsR family regulator